MTLILVYFSFESKSSPFLKPLFYNDFGKGRNASSGEHAFLVVKRTVGVNGSELGEVCLGRRGRRRLFLRIAHALRSCEFARRLSDSRNSLARSIPFGGFHSLPEGQISFSGRGCDPHRLRRGCIFRPCVDGKGPLFLILFSGGHERPTRP